MNNMFRSCQAILFLGLISCAHYSTVQDKNLQPILNNIDIPTAHNIGYENSRQIVKVIGYVVDIHRENSINEAVIISQKPINNISEKSLFEELLEDPENLSYLFIGIPQKNYDILGLRRRNYLKDVDMNKKYNFKVMLLYSEEKLKCIGTVIDYPK